MEDTVTLKVFLPHLSVSKVVRFKVDSTVKEAIDLIRKKVERQHLDQFADDDEESSAKRKYFYVPSKDYWCDELQTLRSLLLKEMDVVEYKEKVIEKDKKKDRMSLRISRRLSLNPTRRKSDADIKPMITTPSSPPAKVYKPAPGNLIAIVESPHTNLQRVIEFDRVLTVADLKVALAARDNVDDPENFHLVFRVCTHPKEIFVKLGEHQPLSMHVLRSQQLFVFRRVCYCLNILMEDGRLLHLFVKPKWTVHRCIKKMKEDYDLENVPGIRGYGLFMAGKARDKSGGATAGLRKSISVAGGLEYSGLLLESKRKIGSYRLHKTDVLEFKSEEHDFKTQLHNSPLQKSHSDLTALISSSPFTSTSTPDTSDSSTTTLTSDTSTSPHNISISTSTLPQQQRETIFLSIESPDFAVAKTLELNIHLTVSEVIQCFLDKIRDTVHSTAPSAPAPAPPDSASQCTSTSTSTSTSTTTTTSTSTSASNSPSIPTHSNYNSSSFCPPSALSSSQSSLPLPSTSTSSSSTSPSPSPSLIPSFSPDSYELLHHKRGMVVEMIDSNTGNNPAFVLMDRMKPLSFYQLQHLHKMLLRRTVLSPTAAPVESPIIQTKQYRSPSLVASYEGGFGLDPHALPQAIDITGLKVPRALVALKQCLCSNNGLDTEGVFRIPGAEPVMKRARTRLEEGREDLVQGTGPEATDVHSLATLIKRFYLNLPQKVLRQVTSEDVLELIDVKANFNQIAAKIPSEQDRHLFLWLTSLACEVVERRALNKINAKSMARLITPSLIDLQSANPLENFEKTSQFTYLIELAFHQTLDLTGEAPPLPMSLSSKPLSQSMQHLSVGSSNNSNINNNSSAVLTTAGMSTEELMAAHPNIAESLMRGKLLSKLSDNNNNGRSTL